MADTKYLKEDDYLSVSEDTASIVYHPSLNVILVFTQSGEVRVLDVNSGNILHSCCLAAGEKCHVPRAKYLPDQDKVLFWNKAGTIGLRGDYNGVLLLDTILQTPISQTDDTVKVEILVSEALIFLQSIQSLDQQGIENTSDVVNEINLKVGEAQKNSKKGIKAQRWETICLELPHSSLKMVASGVVLHLKRAGRHIPALAIASAINERLTDLLAGGRALDVDNAQRFHMFSESTRRQTFEQWPHMDYKWALPDQMAQAGFYHQPGDTGGDRAMCFTCNVCLVCWEKTDEPWSEHERHSPECPFVKGEYTQNVPLSVTYATGPAVPTDRFTIISNGVQSNILCTGTPQGEIYVWNVERQLQKVTKFSIYNVDKAPNFTKTASTTETMNLSLSALASYSRYEKNKATGATKKPNSMSTKAKMLETKIIAGILFEQQVQQQQHDTEMEHDGCQSREEVKLMLVVYQLTETTEKKDHANLIAAGAKKSNSTLSTIEERFEDDEFMKFLASETDLQQLQLLESIIDMDPTKANSNKITECDDLMYGDDSKNDDQKLSKLKASVITAWSQTDSSSVAKQQSLESATTATAPPPQAPPGLIVSPIQLVSIVPFTQEYCEISEIIPSCDAKYILVVVKPTCHQNEDELMETDEVDRQLRTKNVQLILFSVEESGLIDETPVCVRTLDENDTPTEICMLPKYEGKRRVFDSPDTENGIFVMTTSEGSLQLISLSSLKTISEARVDTGKFVSATYCKSLERICACTDRGSLHFYSFYEFDADSSDDRDEECDAELSYSPKSNIIYDAMPSTSSQIPSTSRVESELIAFRNNLTLNDLRVLYSLTLFEELPVPYNAEVPGCWSELIQAQKQRRHPNHLRPGDDTNLTRTWRLHNDATTWDEHLIEINLPKSVPQSIGHIDFKFSLYQPCTNPPAIQVTLLKQKSYGLCCRRKQQQEATSFASNSNENKESCENPVLSEEYLQARNAEILVGPIELSSCMDLSEQGGIVTLTSPKLLKSKSRNFLLHIKTVADSSKDGQGKTRGCDWLHEISITVRAAKHIHKVINERSQRLAMLESNQLLENLLKMVTKDDKMLLQNLAFDILNWITTIRMTRYRSPIPTIHKRSANEPAPNAFTTASLDMNEQQSECIEIISTNLADLIKECMVLSNRSIAHKSSKLLLTLLDGAQSMQQIEQCQMFEESLKAAITDALPYIIQSEHAGALRWFTLLISGTSTLENSHNEVAEKSVGILVDLAREIVTRNDSYSMLLRSRFGLYGLPFEPELFDAELPNLSKCSNLIYTYVPVPKPPGVQIQLGGQIKNVSLPADTSELRVLPLQLRRKGIGNHFKGALEVEPLHYTCCATSEATRLENTDSAMVQSNHLIDDILLETPMNSIDPAQAAGTVGAKKDMEKENLDDDMMNNVKNILVDKIFSSAIKKNKLKEDIKEAAKSFDLEVSVLSGFNENEAATDDWGASETRVVFLTNNSSSASIENTEGNATSAATSASLNNKIQEFFEENNANDETAFQWHRILSTPPKQTIVVDRMHSGARRFITLDFGQPTMLTDLIIPSYPDLASITIDIWCFEEEADSVRLVVSQDIGTKSLVLSDLQPPPICRFLKMTFTGRYGMTGTRCKIPMGAFFGHVVIIEKEGYADPVMKYIKNPKSNTSAQLKVLNALFEDVHCRYCLSSSKLQEYLQPFLNNETSNMAHMQAFLNKTRDFDESNQGYIKIVATYEECIYFQYQLNLIKRVIDRIESLNGNQTVRGPLAIPDLSTDKLRVLSECLIEVLLHCVANYSEDLSALINKDICNLLFDTIITIGDTHTQLAMCSLLVRVCGFQPWWGQFIANIFNRLFSIKNTQIFPQDRIFFLLTYLGRKSISMGLCRTLLIDAILKAVAEILVPLSQNPTAGLWHTTDLTQLSWLLLFLSVCSDDGTEKKESSNLRWDFMSGEGDMAKARMTVCNNSQRNFSRSFKKRYIQKQPLTASHNAEKFSMLNQDYLLFTSNPVQLEQALKQHDQQLKKLQNTIKGKMQSFGDYFNEITNKKQQQQKANEMSAAGRAFQSPSSQTTAEPVPLEVDSSFDKALKSIKSSNMIVVIRGLIGLILAMDFTCNMDLFLLTCKIIARLVYSCRPSLQLSKIITNEQLLQLLRIAVWENQQQPWAVHAITCLLQDILDADKNYQKAENEDEGMEVDYEEGATSSSSSSSNNVVELSSPKNSMFQSILMNGGLPSNTSSSSSSSAHTSSVHPALYADVVKGKLPSLMECEDAEMDDILDTLDNLIEREKKRNKKDTTSGGQATVGNRSLLNGLTVLYRSVSAAMDARLEIGLDTTAEIALRRLTMKSSLKLFPVLSQCGQMSGGNTNFVEPDAWSVELSESWTNDAFQNQRLDTNSMLVEAFDHIFFDLHLEDSWLDLEKVMQIWLILNGEIVEQSTGNGGFGHNSFKPKIALGDPALHALMRTLATVPTVKLRGFCLGFQCLIMACKPPMDPFESGLNNTQEKLCHRIGLIITTDTNFEAILLRFFSGTDRVSTMENSRYAGPTICKLIVELFGCLANKCGCKNQLKELLLRVLLHLVQPGGAISLQQGPIDAQGQLVKELLKYNYDKADLGAAMSIVESISHLVYNNIANEERIYCKKSSDNGSSNNVFGSLFATVLGSESSRHCKTVTDNTVLVSLLKLSLILIKTKIPRSSSSPDNHDEPSGTESQTDESKAAEQGRSQVRYFADTILQYAPTMQRLLNSLSCCTNSSFAMLVASSSYTSAGPSPATVAATSSDTKNAISEPQTVADALFQLLIALTKTATQHDLIVRPLHDFLSSAANQAYALPRLHLSEPFLWFILKVLDTQEAVITFAETGGIRVLCQSLIRSNRTLINAQQGLVSMIMQHISKTSGSLQSNLAGALKKTNIPTTKNEEGLINFAPFCTISSDNPTAQPSDVLIQNPIASHRRARTPAWSYLFYPNESHVDLNITLPAAILLKEIQLQPHISTLASCPSAVAIEITRDSTLGLPISAPISTVGMTCIRLKFNQPEIATGIVIRLYRPKDSTNIGLTQILVLGSTVFSENSNSALLSKPSSSGGNSSSELGEDDVHSKTSLGWLRILAQCFNVATFNQLPDGEMSSLVIAQAAEVQGFLESCCTLLTVAAPNQNYALSNVETVLLKLGLHNKELGLKLIDNLLKLSIPQSLKVNNDAVSDLLYILCTTQDNFTRDRIETMLKWIENLYNQFEQNQLHLAMDPVSSHIKCLASVLWQAYATTLVPDLPNLITKSLFDILYKWSQNLEHNEAIKRAIDAMLCSICCIRPEFFTALLREMGVLVPSLSTDMSAPISDDRKGNHCMTDDSKLMANPTAAAASSDTTSSEWYGHFAVKDLSQLDLSTAQLDTISMACQSPLAIQLLIDSGLPRVFTKAILEFCQNEMSDTPRPTTAGGYPMIEVIKIMEILNFFSDICAEGKMRDWLGSYDGTTFWEPLLHLLCNNKVYTSNRGSMITPQPYLKLEEAVIKFLSRVTACHPKNQENFTTTLIYAIKRAEHQDTNNSYGYKLSISGFTRRLVLQILLESEKIMISVRSDLPLQKKEQNGQFISNHPSKRPNSHHLLFYMSTNSKCHQILEQCGSVYSNLLPSIPVENPSERGQDEPSTSKAPSQQTKNKTFFDLNVGMGLSMELLSVAAGVTAKDKRLKEAKNQAATLKKDFFNVFKMKVDDPKSVSQIVDFGQLIHTACPDFILSNDTTISQILAMLKANKIPLSSPCLNLTLIQGRRTPPCSDEMMRADDDTPPMKAADFVPLPSPLQIFSSRGGLSLLAHYLPTVYPESPKSQVSSSADKEKAAIQANDWVKVEPNEEIYEDLDDTLTDTSSKLPVVTSVPQHSLAAFGLFLKLPAYSEVLLRDKLKAQCLLRLILGVTGDGEGNEIYSLALSSSLPTLPFEVFRQLLDSSPLTTDDGVLLRRMVIEVGAIHLVLNCLGIFTHHTSQSYQVPGAHELQPNVKTTGADEQIPTSDDKSHMYWAKGTGFGTGSTQQSWNVEQALLRQKSEEEHVTVLLQVLSSYVNPGDKIPANFVEDNEMSYRESSELLPELPPIFMDLLQQSCLIAALSSYLRNDSVLDISFHFPLYRAILQLLRAISSSNQLASLLLMRQNGENRTSIATLLSNMKACVETYASRLKVNKKGIVKNAGTSKVQVNLDDGDDEGLALLIPDIQETFMLVQNATSSDPSSRDDDEVTPVERPIMHSIEEKYLELMKKLQFDTYEMIAESENGYRFTVSYHFETNVRMAGDRGHPARVKRLAQETVTLSTSLPLSYSSSVFVRCDTDRLDVMKVLITGPAETPYANGCFEFDVYFPPDYPNSPMMINLETTGRHSVRFNPNLYNDGKVCLSVLNTWHGRPEEKWNAQTSSFLQVLVSIQSLILVSEPYFNEPGFERSRGTPSATHSSREYNSNIYQATVRWAMLEQLKNPCSCFKDVISTHFWLKRNEICTQIESWIAELSKPQYSGRTISFNSMSLRRHYRQLREELAKLPPPQGLEEMNHPFSAAVSLSSPNPSSAVTMSSSSTSSQMNDMDFVVTSPKLDDELSAASTLLHDLSQHVMFNNTAHTTTNTATSTTINSMDDEGSNESGSVPNANDMNHHDIVGESASGSSSSSASGSKEQIASVMMCEAIGKEIKNELDNIFALEEADSSE